ncbi:MAG: hypothetical protein E3J60_00560 [Dehalococcoidia bacterium]|nr:MAG: hypothetical protein E3J60_00560 [Dehalococcoidia bacterium]
MASRNYLVMTNDMSLSDKQKYRRTALAAGLERCKSASIGSIEADVPGLQAIPEASKAARVAAIIAYISTGAWPRTIDQRELAPLTDFVAAAAQDSWLTVALAVGGVVSALNALAAYTLPAGRLLVCYGVSVESAIVPMPVSRLLFRKGGAVGNIQAQFDMEPMGVRQEPDAFFSEPVIIDPQEPYSIQVLGRAVSAAGERVHVHNFLFEGAGLVIA